MLLNKKFVSLFAPHFDTEVENQEASSSTPFIVKFVARQNAPFLARHRPCLHKSPPQCCFYSAAAALAAARGEAGGE